MMPDEVLMTQEGFDKLVSERDELVATKRSEVSEKLKDARSYGDLSENAEFDAAKDEHLWVETRIKELDDLLKNARVVDTDKLDEDSVYVGLYVKVKDILTEESEVYSVLGVTESDPFSEPPKVSYDSPIGKAMFGKKVGEIFEFETPDGKMQYEIESISKVMPD